MKSKSTKVIIAGEVYSDNLGDQLITLGLSTLFKDNKSEDFEIIPYYFSKPLIKQPFIPKETKPEKSDKKIKKTPKSTLFISFIYFVSWIKHNFSGLFHKLKETKPDYILIGGGQLVLSNANFPAALFSWALCAKLLHIPYGFVGIGVGEHHSWLNQKIIHFALKHATFIYVRDPHSLENITRVFHIPASLNFDLAYGYTAPAIANAAQKNKTVWIGITDYAVYQRYAEETPYTHDTHDLYLSYWADIVKSYQKKGYNITLAWTTQADRTETLALYNTLSEEEKQKGIALMPFNLTIDQFMQQLQSVSDVHAGRMHFLIMAQITGCRIHPYFISKKIQTWHDTYTELDLAVIKKELGNLCHDIQKHITSRSRLNIAIVSEELYPDSGGAGIVAWQNANGLAKLSHNVTLYTGYKENRQDTELPKTLKLHSVKRFPKIWPFSYYWSGHWSRYDHILLNDVPALIMGGLFFSDRLFKKTSVFLHSTPERTLGKNFQNTSLGFLFYEKHALRALLKAEHIFSCSAYITEEYIKHFPMLAHKIKTHYAGIELPRYTPSKKPLNNNIITLLTVGRFVKGKGFATQYKIFKRLIRETDKTYKWIIIGDGPYRQEFETIIRRDGFEQHIVCLGALPHDQLMTYYDNADLFWLLSDFEEAFGLVYLEAQIYGTPALGYDRYGVRETIKHKETGFLVKNPLDCFDLISNTSWDTINSKDCIHFAQEFNLEKRVQILNMLLNKKHT